MRLPEDLEGIRLLCSDGSEGSLYSILALQPSTELRYQGGKVLVNGEEQQGSFGEHMNRLLIERKTDEKNDLPFVSGAIGSIDYEYGYRLLNLPVRESSVQFSFYDQALIYDHEGKNWIEVKRGEQSSLPWQQWARAEAKTSEVSLDLQPNWTEEQYTEVFAVLKEHIRRGEIYQACLTFPFFAEAVKEPRQLFAQLWAHNPAPMAAYFEEADREILSLSPERFLLADGKQLETKPIKGTRPRSSDSSEDEQMKAELLADEKEQAELHMITDLLRNDLARVSEAGSVKVVKNRAVQACPTVWHTYSQIQSQAREELSHWDIIESMFPGGSISGCPKRRAVEILSELETHPRGIYTGCIGFISDHGRMDMNIAIRTLEQKNGVVQASFGGGIVYDSQAEREYAECMAKAKPFLSL